MYIYIYILFSCLFMHIFTFWHKVLNAASKTPSKSPLFVHYLIIAAITTKYAEYRNILYTSEYFKTTNRRLCGNDDGNSGPGETKTRMTAVKQQSRTIQIWKVKQLS